MQLQFPIFPANTKMLSDRLSVFEKDEMVYFLRNRMPVYTHSKDDMPTYRYVTATLALLY